MSRYVAVDVGCLECHGSSEVLGPYDTVEEALNQLAGIDSEADLNQFYGQGAGMVYDLVERKHLGPTEYFS